MVEAGRVVLVTGAAGNVGRALAARLAAEGATVVLLDRAEEPLRALEASLPGAGRHLVLAGVDLTSEAACAEGVARITEQLGAPDAVGHTVGGFAMAPLAEAGTEMWEQMFRINVITTANIFRAAMAPMRGRGGAMVAIGAGAGQRAPAGMAAYAAAKAGVLRLVESLADEVKADGIRVNAVLPGTIDTPQNRSAMPGADTTGWVTPEQVAAAIGFLLSEAASGITGALLPVTGRG